MQHRTFDELKQYFLADAEVKVAQVNRFTPDRKPIIDELAKQNVQGVVFDGKDIVIYTVIGE